MIKKIKMLSLILALGLSFGASAQADLCCKDTNCRMQKWNLAFGAFCHGLTQFSSDAVKTDCADFCSEATSGFNITAANVKKCGTTIVNEAKTNSKVANIAKVTFLGSIAGLCTGATFSCKSCEDPVIAKICGILGCNYPGGEAALGQCKNYMTGKSCAAYQ